MIINYKRIAAAEEFYQTRGFELTSVPWQVGKSAYHMTKPDNAPDLYTIGGYLVASAEQSFLHLLFSSKTIDRAVATTPCFRYETSGSTLHHPYFMKVELIDVVWDSEKLSSEDRLESMLSDAETFFANFVETRRVKLKDGSTDLVESYTGIELGSYGTRSKSAEFFRAGRGKTHQEVQELTWVYGTGLAEPRLSQIMEITK